MAPARWRSSPARTRPIWVENESRSIGIVDLPEPGTQNSDKKNEDDINKILKIPKKQSETKSSSTVEQSIINEIRK